MPITLEEVLAGRSRGGVELDGDLPAELDPGPDQAHVALPFVDKLLDGVLAHREPGGRVEALEARLSDVGHHGYDLKRLRELGLEPRTPIATYEDGQVVLYDTVRSNVYVSFATRSPFALVRALSPAGLVRLPGFQDGIDLALDVIDRMTWHDDLGAYARLSAFGQGQVPPRVRRLLDETLARIHPPTPDDTQPPAVVPAPEAPPPPALAWRDDVPALEAAARAAALAGRPGPQFVWASRWLAAAPQAIEAHLMRALGLEALEAPAAVIEATDAALEPSPPESRALVELLLLRARALARADVLRNRNVGGSDPITIRVRGGGVAHLTGVGIGQHWNAEGADLQVEGGVLVISNSNLATRARVATGATVLWESGLIGSATGVVRIDIAPGGRFLVLDGNVDQLRASGGGVLGLATPTIRGEVWLAGDATRFAGLPPAGLRVYERLRAQLLAEESERFRAEWAAGSSTGARKEATGRFFAGVWRRKAFLDRSEEDLTCWLLDQVKRVFWDDPEAGWFAVLRVPGDSGAIRRWLDGQGDERLRSTVMSRARDVVQAVVIEQREKTDLVELLRRYPVGSPHHEAARAALRRGESLGEIELTIRRQEAERARLAQSAWAAEVAAAQAAEEERRRAAAEASPRNDRESMSDWEYFWSGTPSGGGGSGLWDGPGSVDRAMEHLQQVEQQNRDAWLRGAQNWGGPR